MNPMRKSEISTSDLRPLQSHVSVSRAPPKDWCTIAWHATEVILQPIDARVIDQAGFLATLDILDVVARLCLHSSDS